MTSQRMLVNRLKRKCNQYIMLTHSVPTKSSRIAEEA